MTSWLHTPSDGRGYRIAKVVARYEDPSGDNPVLITGYDRTDFYFNVTWQVVEERSAVNVSGEQAQAPASTVKLQYAWSATYIDTPICRFAYAGGTLTQTLYYTADANHSVTALVDGTSGSSTAGQVVERYISSAYGEVTFMDGGWTVLTNGSAFNNVVTYCGYLYNTETGTFTVRHREYNPKTGQWLTRDYDTGFADGNNLYQYCQSNPVNRDDSSGWDSGWLDSSWKSGAPVSIGYTVTHWYMKDEAPQRVIGGSFGAAEAQYLSINGGRYIKFRGQCYSVDNIEQWVRERGAKGSFTEKDFVDALGGMITYPVKEADDIRLTRIMSNVLNGCWCQSDTDWCKALVESLRESDIHVDGQVWNLLTSIAKAPDTYVSLRAERFGPSEAMFILSSHAQLHLGGTDILTVSGANRMVAQIWDSTGWIDGATMGVPAVQTGEYAYRYSASAGFTLLSSLLPRIVGKLPNSNAAWGRNRLIKELHDRGFVLRGPSDTGGGLVYLHPQTKEAVRIMPRPKRTPFRGEPMAKFDNDYYYRYQPNENLPEGPHITLPNPPKQP